MPDGPVPVAIGLMFHPDLLHGTALAKKMKQFTFFSYTSNEALHLSSDECSVIQNYVERCASESNPEYQTNCRYVGLSISTAFS